MSPHPVPRDGEWQNVGAPPPRKVNPYVDTPKYISDPTPAGAAPRDEAREISSREDAKQRTCRAVIAFVRGGASDWGFLEGEVYAALDAVLAAAPRADPDLSAEDCAEVAKVVRLYLRAGFRSEAQRRKWAALADRLDRKAAPPCDDAALCSTPAVAAGPLGASLGVGSPESCWSRASHNAEDSPTAQEASARETLGRKLYEHYGNSAIEWRYRSEAHHEAWRQDAADILAALKIATGEAVLAGARKP